LAGAGFCFLYYALITLIVVAFGVINNFADQEIEDFKNRRTALSFDETASNSLKLTDCLGNWKYFGFCDYNADVFCVWHDK
jgi:hypothetical protein